MIVDIVFENQRYDGYKFDLSNDTVISYKRPKPIILNPWIQTNKNYYRKVVDLILDNKKKKILFHRLVYQMHNPIENIKGIIIDHIDQNSLNNDINNLRLATHSQNCANISKSSKNRNIIPTSKYIGISYSKKDDAWAAEIKVEKIRFRKQFKNEKDALYWRNNKIIELKVDNFYSIQPWIKKKVVITSK